jgi:vanillate O-demethylase monooxygenase subunit
MGLVWVALEEPLAPLLQVPEWDAPGIVAVWLPDTTIRSGSAQFIDNFLDIAHFPFVHAGTFGVDQDEGLGHMEVEADADGAGLRVPYRHQVANPEDPLVATGEHPLVQYRRMEYAWRMPFAARLRLDYELTGVENTVVVALAPIDATTSRLFCVLLRNDLAGADDPRAAEACEFEYRVLTEDLSILERLAERDFGLEVTQQVHTRADRTTIELRRLLAAQLDQADDATAASVADARVAPASSTVADPSPVP